MKVCVKFFGALKQYSPPGAETALHLEAQAPTIADVRRALAPKGGHPLLALLASSAFANEDRILGEDEAVSDGMRLAVLPPVCGG